MRCVGSCWSCVIDIGSNAVHRGSVRCVRGAEVLSWILTDAAGFLVGARASGGTEISLVAGSTAQMRSQAVLAPVAARRAFVSDATGAVISRFALCLSRSSALVRRFIAEAGGVVSDCHLNRIVQLGGAVVCGASAFDFGSVNAVMDFSGIPCEPHSVGWSMRYHVLRGQPVVMLERPPVAMCYVAEPAEDSETDEAINDDSAVVPTPDPSMHDPSDLDNDSVAATEGGASNSVPTLVSESDSDYERRLTMIMNLEDDDIDSTEDDTEPTFAGDWFVQALSPFLRLYIDLRMEQLLRTEFWMARVSRFSWTRWWRSA